MSVRIRMAAAVLAAVIAPACAELPPRRDLGIIEGKAVFQKERVAGAKVTAAAKMGVSGLEQSYTAVTDAEGVFRLVVPPGSYHLFYHLAPDLFGYFGGNPVNVLAGVPSQVVLRGARWSGKSTISPSAETAITGIAHRGDEPVAAGTVMVFLDASSNFRGPGYALSQTDWAGRFTISLPAGRYYVLGRQRKGSDRMGPLKVGDRYAWYPGNPVFLREGESVGIDLPFMEVEKDPSKALVEASRGSLVSGTVIRTGGTPVAGVIACLYKGPDPLGMPAFVSEGTDDGGRFVIRVTEPGFYYLAARAGIGRALTQSEHVAFYRGPSGSRVTVESGVDLKDLSIVWEGN